MKRGSDSVGGDRPASSQPATEAANSSHWDVEEGPKAQPSDPGIESRDCLAEPVLNPNPTVPAHSRPASEPIPSGNGNNNNDDNRPAPSNDVALENFVDARARESSDGISPTSSVGANSFSTTPLMNVYNNGQQAVSSQPQQHHRQQLLQQTLMANQLGSVALAGGASTAEYNSFTQAPQHQMQSSSTSTKTGSMHKVPSTTSTSSSSSSLATMAAAMALGGPSQVMLMQQKLQAVRAAEQQHQPMMQVSSVNYTSTTSPMTPVHMMGSPSGQEAMMLPPPPRFPCGPGTYVIQNQQHHGFIPQMNPAMQSHSLVPSQQQQQQQHHQQQQQQLALSNPNHAALGQPPQQHQIQPQQIQIGINGGHTIPITAVAAADGTIQYKIDSSAVPCAGLKNFTKAINQVAKPDDQELDPALAAKKRAQRLARNRESARNSRRRKKEQLSSLSTKVKKLQNMLDVEIRNKIKTMEVGMARQRVKLLNNSVSDHNGAMASVFRLTSVNCPVRRAVLAHQFGSLRRAFIANHNQYAIWMMMHSSSFFTAAHNYKNDSLTASGRKNPGNARNNSKQIGEELANEEKFDGNAGATCDATDELRAWPLYCHEVVMTMEQEERIINQAHEEFQKIDNLPGRLNKMKLAVSTTHHLQNAMSCHSHLASKRNDSLLLDVLTPEQTMLFLQWLDKNKKRCGEAARDIGKGGSRRSTLDAILTQLEELKPR
ncbi:hypothetical protein THAOC_12443 [Thalassiosira oceanica]|uniref:BZIP domain-containing protein n=1 Tax=Thalassiosira oceanica TaxID=159749 RepID=K0SMM7_THAOC|nr:hypothetical protein THAOC_12443 [Thalassiosira oceanica]|eukprot:EJK66630.1 hypothetical protein THAOC_12443 [Thalassiosira oceanica]